MMIRAPPVTSCMVRGNSGSVAAHATRPTMHSSATSRVSTRCNARTPPSRADDSVYATSRVTSVPRGPVVSALGSVSSTRHRIVARSASSSGLPTVEDVRPALSAEELEEWEKCLVALEGLDLPHEEAERILAKGFGWLGQGYWRSEKVNEPPTLEHVTAKLAYLQDDLGIQGADLISVLKKFPETLGLSLEDLLKPNMQRLEKEWFMKGAILTKALIRKPQTMGLSVDCEGTCQGLCSKCWAAN
eukprot:gene13546-19416_t